MSNGQPACNCSVQVRALRHYVQFVSNWSLGLIFMINYCFLLQVRKLVEASSLCRYNLSINCHDSALQDWEWTDYFGDSSSAWHVDTDMCSGTGV